MVRKSSLIIQKDKLTQELAIYDQIGKEYKLVIKKLKVYNKEEIVELEIFPQSNSIVAENKLDKSIFKINKNNPSEIIFEQDSTSTISTIITSCLFIVLGFIYLIFGVIKLRGVSHFN